MYVIPLYFIIILLYGTRTILSSFSYTEGACSTMFRFVSVVPWYMYVDTIQYERVSRNDFTVDDEGRSGSRR